VSGVKRSWSLFVGFVLLWRRKKNTRAETRDRGLVCASEWFLQELRRIGNLVAVPVVQFNFVLRSPRSGRVGRPRWLWA